MISDKTVNSIFKPFCGTILSIALFILCSISNTFAQKEDKGGINPQNTQGTNQGIAPVDPKEPQLEDGKTIEEGQKMKDDYLIWKMFTIEDEKSSRDGLKTNYDSLYNAFKSMGEQIGKLSPNYMVIIVPNKYAFLLNKVNPKFYNKLVPYNNYFSTLTVLPFENNESIRTQMAELDQTFKKSTFTNKEIIEGILPAIALTNNKPASEATYQNQVLGFFASYPDLVHYCNKSFAKMLVRKQFDKILKLQMASNNIINMPTESTDTANKQSK